MPVKRKIASRESGNHEIVQRFLSFPVLIAVACAAASGQGNAILAKRLPGDLQHIEAPAPFARGVFIDVVFRGRLHALAKPSAKAIAFRIAMDLLTVSENSASGVESFTQPPPAWT